MECSYNLSGHSLNDLKWIIESFHVCANTFVRVLRQASVINLYAKQIHFSAFNADVFWFVLILIKEIFFRRSVLIPLLAMALNESMLSN